MVIEELEDLSIPMSMEVSTCGITTHPPTGDEIHNCQRILRSDGFNWDTSKNLFEISSMEEEYRTSSNFHNYINIIERRIPSAPPTVQRRYDSGIHDFDTSMANVSIGIAHDLMVDILIRNVRVSITRSG